MAQDFYIVTFYNKWVMTSWTYSSSAENLKKIPSIFVVTNSLTALNPT